MKLLAIDTGISGGIATRDSNGIITCYNMPSTLGDIVELLRGIKLDCNKAIVEKAGQHRQGNSASSSVKFANHFGQIEAILYCLGYETEYISPQKWMKKLGTLPKDRAKRKRAIKEIVQKKYPYLRITLKTADAIALLSITKDI